MVKPNGLSQRKSSLTAIDKWSELDCENRPLYTEISGEVPKGTFHTISRSRLDHALITLPPRDQYVTWLGRDRKWEQERYLDVIRVRAEWGYVHAQYAVHVCFLMLGWLRISSIFLCLLSGQSFLLFCSVILCFRCSRLLCLLQVCWHAFFRYLHMRKMIVHDRIIFGN